MRVWRVFGIVAAVALHVGFLLFGGAIFNKEKEVKKNVTQVDLLSEDAAAIKEKEKEKKPDPAPEKKEDIEAESEKAPDASEMLRSPDLQVTNDAPALEAASLSAIESALNGGGSGGDFGDAMSFASGGRIGGTGKAGALDEKVDNAFSLAEIDQKPRVMFKAAPAYPTEMRGKKLEGVVSLIFVVDPAGKVGNPKVEKSSNVAFERPALDAVRQWKFEPAVRGGQRVDCRMRISIRFPAT